MITVNNINFNILLTQVHNTYIIDNIMKLLLANYHAN